MCIIYLRLIIAFKNEEFVLNEFLLKYEFLVVKNGNCFNIFNMLFQHLKITNVLLSVRFRLLYYETEKKTVIPYKLKIIVHFSIIF